VLLQCPDAGAFGSGYCLSQSDRRLLLEIY